MRNAKAVGIFCSVLLLATGSGLAKDKNKKDQGKANPGITLVKAPDKVEVKTASPAKEPMVKVTISSHERETIRQYISDNDSDKKGKKAKGIPPGLQKKAARGDLPPGWEKKLGVGQVIPVEVLKECKPLPVDLLMKLPPSPRGVITVAVEGKVVRLLEATREILDVFDVLK